MSPPPLPCDGTGLHDFHSPPATEGLSRVSDTPPEGIDSIRRVYLRRNQIPAKPSTLQNPFLRLVHTVGLEPVGWYSIRFNLCDTSDNHSS